MMFAASAVGSRLSTRFSVRGIVRTGLSLTGLASLLLLATMQPDLDESSFAFAMGVLGLGMGLIASQLGNVVQSSVDASGPWRSRRPAVHRPAARVVDRCRTDRWCRPRRARQRLRVERPGRRSPRRHDRTAGGRRRRGRHRLRVGRLRRAGSHRCRAGRRRSRRDRRGLRRRAAPGAQDRAVRCGAPRARLARLHGEPAERRSATARRRGSGRLGRCSVSPSSGASAASRCGRPDGRAPRASGAAGCGPPRSR